MHRRRLVASLRHLRRACPGSVTPPADRARASPRQSVGDAVRSPSA